MQNSGAHFPIKPFLCSSELQTGLWLKSETSSLHGIKSHRMPSFSCSLPLTQKTVFFRWMFPFVLIASQKQREKKSLKALGWEMIAIVLYVLLQQFCISHLNIGVGEMLPEVLPPLLALAPTSFPLLISCIWAHRLLKIPFSACHEVFVCAHLSITNENVPSPWSLYESPSQNSLKLLLCPSGPFYHSSGPHLLSGVTADGVTNWGVVDFPNLTLGKLLGNRSPESPL